MDGRCLRKPRTITNIKFHGYLHDEFNPLLFTFSFIPSFICLYCKYDGFYLQEDSPPKRLIMNIRLFLLKTARFLSRGFLLKLILAPYVTMQTELNHTCTSLQNLPLSCRVCLLHISQTQCVLF